MKNLFYVNIWLYVMTLFMYITLYFGFLFQLLLGFSQIIMAILLVARITEIKSNLKVHLLFYWFVTIGYLIFYSVQEPMRTFEFSYMVLTVTVLPLVIAGYFTYITYLVKRWKEKGEE